jgi:hypothetical protein
MEFINAIKVYRKSGGSPAIAFTESTTEPHPSPNPCRQ